MKTPKIQAPKEDPAVTAQRQAAEKAAQDDMNAAVGDMVAKKTRLVSRVFGGASPGAIAASNAAKTAAPATPNYAPFSYTSINGFRL